MNIQLGKIYKVKEGSKGRCGSFKRHNGEFVKITGLNDYLRYDILDNKREKVTECSYCLTADDLIPLVKDWDSLREGDRVRDKDGDEREVLGICGKVIFLSWTIGFGLSNGSWTKQELIKRGFTIVQDEPEEKETVEILGKKYEKQAVEERLKELKEVE